MQYNDNARIKKALVNGEKVSAAWAQAASNITIEVLGESGFDVIFIDMEHGPGDIQTLISQIQALKGLGTVPLVRAPWNDFVQIKRILDAGAYGLLVPYINTKEEAEQVVRAVRYPTEGIRGVAGSARAAHYGNKSIDYFKSANDNIFIMVAIETKKAAENLSEILEVEGIDGIFIGPVDLASSLGHLGNPKEAEVQELIGEIEKVVFPSDKFLSTTSGSFEDAEKKFNRGYGMVTLMSDTVSLGKLARELIAQFKELK